MPVIYETVAGKVWFRTITQRLIRATFNRSIVVDDLLDISKYSIELISAQGNIVSVLDVKGADPDGNGETLYADLFISKPTIDSVYKITISNLRTGDAKLIESVYGYVKSRLTKVDSILSKLPKMYNTDLNASTLTQLIIGFGSSDDLIGGGEDYDAINLESTVTASSTYGTATFGTSTFGG